MADANLGTATVRTRMDTSGLRTGISDAKGALTGFGRDSQRTLTSIGKGFQQTGGLLTRGLTLPLVGAGAAIVKVAADFERATNRVAALSGAQGAAFDRLRDQAKELGSATQFSATQAAEAQAFLAQAGFTTDQIFKSLPGTLNLAGAAQLDLGRSADIVSNILTGFQLDVSELDRAVDVLAKAFTSSNTDLEQLGQGFKFVGPVASAFGVGLEETAAALGLLGNAGLQASTAGTGLRRIISTLAKEQDKLGISTVDATGKLRPLADIIEDIEARGLTAAEALAIFGDRGGPAISALLSQGSGALRELTANLEDAAGTAERIQAVQLQGLAGQLTQLKSAGEGLAIAFGDTGLLTSVTGVVTGLTNMVRRVAELEPGTQRLLLAVGGFGIILGPLLTQVGNLLVALPKITAALGLLRTAGLAMLGPAGWVIGAAVAIGGLAVAIGRSKADRDSLVAATDTAQAALAGGDKASLVSALDEVAKKVNGDTRASLQALRADLIQTGDVSIEQAARIAGAIAQARNLEPTTTGRAANYSTAVREALTVAGQSLGSDVLGSVEAALNDGKLAFAIGDTGLAIDRLTRTIDGLPLRNPALERQRDVLVGFREELIAAQTEAIDTGLRGFAADVVGIIDPGTRTGAESTAGSIGAFSTGSGTGSGSTDDEVEDILAAARAWTGRLEAELRFGIKAAEDVFDLLEPRAADLRVAAGNALRDFGFDSRQYQDAVTKLDYIDGVLARLSREYNITLRAPDAAVAINRGAGVAGQTLPAGVIAGQEAAAAAQARAALSADQLADAARIAADTQVQYAAAQRDDLFARARVLGATDYNPAVESQARMAASQAAAAAAVRDTQALRDILVDTLRATVDAGGDVSVVFDAIGRAGVALDDDLQTAFDGISAKAGVASVDLVDLYLATQQVSDATPAASRGMRALADDIDGLQRAADRASRPVPIPIPGVGIDYLTPAPQGLEGIFGPGTGDDFRGIFDENGQQLVRMGEFSSQQIKDAAIDFRLQVASAAIGFTFTLIDQLKRGDIGGAIGSTFNAAGSIAGGVATFGAALGMTAATVATAGIAAIALPIVGGLIGGIANLFGGKTGADPAGEREREANERRQRSTPAITITANVSQTNHFGSDLVDPRVRAEVDRMTRDVVGEVLRQTGYADIRRAALGAAT